MRKIEMIYAKKIFFYNNLLSVKISILSKEVKDTIRKLRSLHMLLKSKVLYTSLASILYTSLASLYN